MNSRIPQSRSDLERLLQEQIGFLGSSCKLFDEGAVGEAKRLALTIRILLHDTKKSTSLLLQLGMKDKQFLNTASEYNPANILTHSGLCAMKLSGKSATVVPYLDEPVFTRSSDFEEWWNQIIIVDDRKQTFSRKTLILYTANEDGGAHIDPELTEKYSRLTKENSLKWMVISSDEPPRELEGHETASIRQIAHEVLRTLNPALPSVEPKSPADAATFRDFEIIVEPANASHHSTDANDARTRSADVPPA